MISVVWNQNKVAYLLNISVPVLPFKLLTILWHLQMLRYLNMVCIFTWKSLGNRRYNTVFFIHNVSRCTQNSHFNVPHRKCPVLHNVLKTMSCMLQNDIRTFLEVTDDSFVRVHWNISIFTSDCYFQVF